MNLVSSVLFTILILFSLVACESSYKKTMEKPVDKLVKEDVAKEKEQEMDGESAEDKVDESVSTDDANIHKSDEITESETGKPDTKGEQPVTKEKAALPSDDQPSVKNREKPTEGNRTPSKKENVEKKQTVAQPRKSEPVPAQKQTNKSVERPKKTKSVKDEITYSIVISSSEVPLPPTKMEINEGDTVLQALIKITKENKIQMDYRGGQGATAYVEGIDNVYEFDRGQGSGWMYRVNGIFPDRGAGVVPLLPGDRVEWLYTTDLGKDLGADLQPFRR